MQHRAHIAHHVKGRLRVRVPSAKGNPAALEKIKQALSGLTGVQDVSVNEATGSVTVNYDPKRHVDFHAHLSSNGAHKEVVHVPAPPPQLSEIDEAAEMLGREVEYLTSHSHSAKAVVDFFHKCDLELKKATDNQLDLKVLAPLALAAYAFMELGFEGSTPVWLTLGLFSFNHFIDLQARHEMETGITHAIAPRRRGVRTF